ncbi:MAG: prepilin-type N-terminal cleavage/methylation domain-containing protein [Blastocatellia bacterium]
MEPKERVQTEPAEKPQEQGFTMTELMIAMMVFTVIMGSVVALLGKSQTIFRAEQGVSEMDQNARLLMDFLTRDIQQSKENSLGLGQRFRSIYSSDGPEGKTDEVTIVSSDTESKLPSGALPFIPASTRNFAVGDHYVEILPNTLSRVDPNAVINALTPNEEFIVSSVLQDGSVQFDFIKVTSAKLTSEGAIGLTFDAVEHRGVQPEVAFGSSYDNGSFTLRPVTIKRYFVDRKSNKEHPTFALSIDNGPAISIARNVVAFQLRYLEVKDGELDGSWVRQQNISREYKTSALEVTMTARTELKNDPKAERLVTLASVIRPRLVPGGGFGSAPGGGTSSPGLPGEGGTNGSGGDGGGFGGPGAGVSDGFGGDGFGGNGRGALGDDNSSAFGGGGYNYRTRRIGKKPRLGERLNPRP